MAQNAYDYDISGVWDQVYPRQYNPDDVREIIREEISEAIHNPNFADIVLDNSVPINAVSRSLTRIFFSPASISDYTISATTMAKVDETDLAGNISCSGRPVLLQCRIRGMQAGGASALVVGFFWDSSSLEGTTGQFVLTATTISGVSFWTIVPTPTAGDHNFSLGAYRVTSNGTIYSGGGNSIELLAMEI